MNQTTQRIERGQQATLASIQADYNSGDFECLYFASEEQVSKLIEQGKISEDAFSHHQDYQEELRVLMAEFTY